MTGSVIVAGTLGPLIVEGQPIRQMIVSAQVLTAVGTVAQPETVRFDQTVAASLWTVQHNMSQYPSATVVIGGAEVDALVTYVDENQITVTFLAPHTGSVFLN